MPISLLTQDVWDELSKQLYSLYFPPTPKFSVFPLWLASVHLFTAHYPITKMNNFSFGNLNSTQNFGISISENLNKIQLYSRGLLVYQFQRQSTEDSRILGQNWTDCGSVCAACCQIA